MNSQLTVHRRFAKKPLLSENATHLDREAATHGLHSFTRLWQGLLQIFGFGAANCNC